MDSGQTDTGGPAYPTDSQHQPANHILHMEGMTLLDWFAGQTLIAINSGDFQSCSDIAVEAYGIASAMIAEKRRREAETK